MDENGFILYDYAEKEERLDRMKVTVLQPPIDREKRKNLENVAHILEQMPKKPDLLTLPEMFLCPYQAALFPKYAEEEGGEAWHFLSDLARKHGIYLSAGSVPECSEGRIYNTAYVFDREGRQIAKHRKMHLFDIEIKGGQHFRESDTLTAGDEVTTFDTEFGILGLCICYDFRFPELSRMMVDKGAKLILCPASFNMTTGPMHWEVMFRSRAIDNQVFTIGTAPMRDASLGYTSWGHSIVVDPWGKVVAQLEEGAGMLHVEVDLSEVDRVRAQLPLLRHRRRDCYRVERIEK